MVDRMSIDGSAVQNSAVSVEGLGKSFGDTDAVRDLSFEAPLGQVMGLLGPNGAGKTTTIKMLTTLLPLDTGRATVAGFDVASQPGDVRRAIGLAGQAAAVDEKLTGRENLELFGRLYKIPKSARRRRVGDLIDRFDLTEFADRTVDTYSGGQRRRLDLIACLIAQPQVLFLDEPTTGLDPRSRSGLWQEIRQLAASGTSVVLTTQYLDEADQLADSIVIIDEGAIRASGTAASLKSSLKQDVLEIHVASLSDVDAVAASIGGGAVVDRESRRIQIPVPGGAQQSLETLRRISDAAIDIEDFQLRKPTLDDVFLAMTDERTAL